MEHHGYMISEELYRWILDNIPKGSTILELGSGDGTKMLSKFYHMISIEHNPKYQNLHDSRYICASLKDNWFDVDVLKKELPKKGEYDLILVDAPPAFNAHARLGFYHNRDLFDLSVPIIIDDTHREGERLLANSLFKVFNPDSKNINRGVVEVECSNKSFVVFK